MLEVILHMYIYMIESLSFFCLWYVHSMLRVMIGFDGVMYLTNRVQVMGAATSSGEGLVPTFSVAACALRVIAGFGVCLSPG